MAADIAIEVVYARPEAQEVVALRVARGTTLRQAIEQSGLLQRHAGIDLRTVRAGVFGEPRPLDAPVEPGDRVEIYRPLVVDPKERRRRRSRG